MRVKVAVAGVVVALLLGLFAYNKLPGFTVEPDKGERHRCRPEGGGYYRWSVLDHDWVCRDNWVFPGVPGV